MVTELTEYSSSSNTSPRVSLGLASNSCRPISSRTVQEIVVEFDLYQYIRWAWE